MLIDTRDVINDALIYYKGWFDELSSNDDFQAINEINQALNSKKPLDFGITTDALADYQSMLEDTIEQNKTYHDYENKDLDIIKTKIDAIDKLIN